VVGRPRPRTAIDRAVEEVIARRRAAIYCRVSTAAQAEEDRVSLAEQLTACEHYCRDHGYEIVARFRDVKSGATSRRPDFQRLIQGAAAGEFDVVVCWKVDRLGRGLFPMARLLEACEPGGVQIEAVKEKVDQRYLGLFASVGKIELDNIRERTMEMRRAHAKKNKLMSGSIPYGYRADPDGLPQVHPEEAAVLLEIARRYVAGEPVVAIARDLRARAVPTRRPHTAKGPAWPVPYLSRLLADDAYATGKRRYGGTEMTYPVLFPPELAAAIRERKRLNTSLASRNTREQYLLQHLLVCGVCGRTLSPSTHRRYTGKDGAMRDYVTPRRLYRCVGEGHYGYKCRAAVVHAGKVEGAVWDTLVAALREPERLLDGVRARLRALEVARREQEGPTGEAERHLARLRQEALEIARQRIKGKIDDARLDFLEAEHGSEVAHWEQRAADDRRLLDGTRAEREVLEAAERRLVTLQERYDRPMEALPFAARRTLVLALVERVVVGADGGVAVEGVISGAGEDARDGQRSSPPPLANPRAVPTWRVPFVLVARPPGAQDRPHDDAHRPRQPGLALLGREAWAGP
jgi:DNA invertase Pin-like site-specific DNA recombinase